MTRECVCGVHLDDWCDVRFTVKGDTNWYCSFACATLGRLLRG